MADAIVSVVLEQLFSITAKEMEQKVRLVTGVEKEIEQLKSNFQVIQAVLGDAENRRMKKDEAVGRWLDGLKGASYDIDDILDEWRFAIIKLQMEGAHQNPKKKVCSFFPSPRFCFKQVGLRHDIALRIKEVNQNLDFIAKEKDRYNLVVNRSIDEPQRSKTTSFFGDVSEIRGRDEEKKDLVSMLLSDGSEKGKHPHVISIVGMGGIGKTTLAQLAYNDEEVKAKFHKRIWICVSDSFDEIKIVKAIIEGLKGKPSKCVELQSHLECIYESVKEKKFLLVLDDVWIEEYNWGPLYNCLNNGLCGSKILVTTRKEVVAHTMKSSDTIKVKELIKDESWSLFKQFAFSNRPEQEQKNLEKIGRDIVDKCKGLPLAVKVVGSLLYFKKTEQQWQRILDNEFWNLEELEKGLFPPLLLSYNELPLKEKRCFSYCAVFPKDYEMDKNELIQLWMAQGYLGVEESEELETIGQDCFDNLEMHSFFQKFETNWKMHDIVHDFAQFLVKNECFTIEINSSEAQSLKSSNVKARHIKLILNNKEASLPSNICSAQKLRSLLIKDKSFYDRRIKSGWVLPNIFESLTCLGALEFSTMKHLDRKDIYIMIPKEIGKLIHLRYLNMSKLKIKEIPETLCNLYNLQTLNLDRCRWLEKLPQGMGKLINLRHLITSDCEALSYMPRGVENLTSLRTLSWLVAGGGTHVSSLGSLQNLNHLGGGVTLRRLGNVGDSAEAQRAQLYNKKNLTGLSLWFDDGGEASASPSVIKKDGAVLQALQPPLNLKKLDIRHYRGTSFPEWMTSLTQLKDLDVTGCIKCEQLPALGKLPSLEFLDIQNMESVKRVGNEFLGIENASTSSSSSSFIAFPKLKDLRFSDMTEWEDWDDHEITRQITIMPSLSSLNIFSCLKLKALPKYILHATSLKSCKIRRLKCEQLPAFGKLPSLESLEIGCMESVKRVGIEFLGIENASTSSSSSSFIAFPKLMDLDIWGVTEWEDWDDHEITRQITIMPSLSSLLIYHCPKLKALPKYILHATSLKSCKIRCLKCEQLPAFGKLPSLESLEIGYIESVKRVGIEFLGIENASISSSSSSFIAFPKLMDLDILCMGEWEDWDDHEITRQITIMPSVSSLNIFSCPKLKALPEYILHATSLKSCCISGLKCEQLPALWKLPSLESLEIRKMKSVKRVGNEFLGIENASTSSSSSSFIAFPKLKDLRFLQMTEWEDWDDHEITRQITIMPSLSSLDIRDCPKLKALPEYILHATSLKSCRINSCPELEKRPPME